MKKIILFGAGKSATYLIDYLLSESTSRDWLLYVADENLHLADSKTSGHPNARPLAIDVTNPEKRKSLIASADLVISLMPPFLHEYIANDCVELEKNLLTASYVDNITSLEPQIKSKGVLFLCEMGLDPGIDHMSAMAIINRIKSEGGKILSFKSHCGGLVAPESDNNPWRYKISWNPKNVVQAGKAGAQYKSNGEIVSLSYGELFDPARVVEVPELGYLSWYPNRDSSAYINLYSTPDAHTFVRTTLRYPEFCFGWKNLIDLKLTDETIKYDTNGMSLQQFFQLHFNQHGFSDWIEKQLTSRFTQTKMLLEKLQELLTAEEGVSDLAKKELQEFMMVDDHGMLMDINLDDVKTKAAATVAGQMHEANLSIKQLLYLGMDDDKTQIDKGLCSAADVLQFAIEKKLALQEDDKDMIVMLHEIQYTLNDEHFETKSFLVLTGADNTHTAMSKTVGLPLAIGAKLIMEGTIDLKGLHVPVLPEIYEPVLQELKLHGIEFYETTVKL